MSSHLCTECFSFVILESFVRGPLLSKWSCCSLLVSILCIWIGFKSENPFVFLVWTPHLLSQQIHFLRKSIKKFNFFSFLNPIQVPCEISNELVCFVVNLSLSYICVLANLAFVSHSWKSS